ncbi:hypothetical protein PCANB_000531 [Pneumocystis canis]|nr:hypothetical protein PCK1_000623 [Pneumocystis canis]KAG5437817.1 hypothetical protein PCANB_000531 [Pneumocystis canis]
MKRKLSNSSLFKKSLSLNNLPWKKVDISHKLGNLEGFVDLEEVDGIELNIKRNKQEEVEVKINNENNKKIKHKIPKSDVKAGILHQKQNIFKKKINFEKEKALFNSESANIFQEFDKISIDLPEWTNFGLSDITLKGLSSFNFLSPTPIQKMAIPSIMKGNSVIVKAETGSGKTLAFGVPVMEYIIKNVPTEVSSLILAPTRELAHQIMNHLESVSKFSSLFIVTIVGGMSIQKQERLLKKKPDIIVATPGRLWEVMDQNEWLVIMLSKIRFLILDEADRLLQEGHFKELGEILGVLKKYKIERQILIFSATFKKSLQKKIKNSNFFETNISAEDEMELFLKKLNFGKQLEFIDANPQESIPKKIKEGIIECKDSDKDLYLYYFLLKYPGHTIVFINSIEHVHHVSLMLSEFNLKPLSLHSKLHQKQRLKMIEKFNTDKTSILVTSDIAARGLDISGIQHVIHYHLPRSADLYIHRSGRTARAQNSGVSILLCAPSEIMKFRKMLFSLGKNVNEMLSFSVDYSLLKKLKPRIVLGRKITNAIRYINKQHHDRDWLKKAADDLGVDLNELDSKNNNEKKNISKKDLQILRLELKKLLSQTLHSGFSQKYLTNGTDNIAQNIIEGKMHPTFLDTRKIDALDVF